MDKFDVEWVIYCASKTRVLFSVDCKSTYGCPAKFKFQL